MYTLILLLEREREKKKNSIIGCKNSDGKAEVANKEIEK